MDPYHILGVSTTSTREEVEAAFRARVRQYQPDRGVEHEDFIQLCAAYQQILGELDRCPKSGPLARARTPRHGRPLVPFDRDWEPDLILLDEPPGSDRLPNPPDPNWEPDLILLDQPSPLHGIREPSSPDIEGGAYFSWFRRVSEQASRGESIWQSRSARTIGVVLLFGILGGNLWLCWRAWTYDPVEAAREAEFAATISQRTAAQQHSDSNR
jgi:DnaJ domain